MRVAVQIELSDTERAALAQQQVRVEQSGDILPHEDRPTGQRHELERLVAT